MAISKLLQRELEVAFSKASQPVWFRILKYIVLGCVVYFFWGSPWLWITLLLLTGIAMIMHFWYRHKTEGWTKSYGLWKYDKGDKV